MSLFHRAPYQGLGRASYQILPRGAASVLFLLCVAATFGTAAELPRKSPDLAIALPTGESISPAGFRGKTVALAFLATGCPHCRSAAQTLERLYRRLRSKGAQVMGATINGPEQVPDFVSELGLSFPVGSVEPSEMFQYLQPSPSQPFLMPQVALIDRQGIICAVYSGATPALTEPELLLTLKRLMSAGSCRVALARLAPLRSGARRVAGSGGAPDR